MELDEFMGFDSQAEEMKELEEKRKARENKETHIQTWFDAIKRSKKHDSFYRKRWAEDRKIARGESNLPVSTNLISAIMDVLSAFLYAKNPDLNARPSDSVDRQRLEAYREFAHTIEIMASRLLKDAKLKRQAKRWIRGAQTVGLGWLKVFMQTRTEKEPIMQSRINDLQDQIDKIRTKKIRMTLGEEDEGLLISEIESNIKAAEEKLEMTVAEGGVVDYTHPEDVIVAPECGEVENYLSAPWICFCAYKTKDETLAITKWETQEQVEYLEKANKYSQRPRKGEDGESGSTYAIVGTDDDSAESKDGFYCIYEIWSLDDGVVYTLVDGCTSSWAREPYAPITGKRFYPAFLLAFHFIDGERYPQSDVHQLAKLQEEYNETRSDYRIHRRRARPGIIFDAMAVDKVSVENAANAETQEYVAIDMIQAGKDINTVFAAKKYNPVDPGLYDTTPIQRDMEKMSGAQEALTQSSLQIEKTATEASIQEAGRGARTDARLDDLEDALTELVEYFIQLMLQTMDQADAERYAGPGAVWMNLTTDQALSLFDIEIKAGSTGKPKAASDRDTWATLMPLILDLIMKIGDARMQGKEWAAKPLIAVFQETLTRLDDHADIQMFLPVVPPEEVQAAGKPDPKIEAEIKLDEASSVDKMASAVQKVPALVFSPEMRQLLGMDQEQDATVESLMGALQGQQQPGIPAPNPLQ